VIFAAALLVAASTTPSAAGETLTGIATVVDGHTLILQRQRIRLAGIAAPHPNLVCRAPDGTDFPAGAFAAAFLQQLIETQWLACEVTAPGSDGQPARARCALGEGGDLNAALVSGGLARADGPEGEPYRRYEAQARAGRVGFWVMDCGGGWGGGRVP
jgi:endonuclease YncB( thermonuclease family)